MTYTMKQDENFKKDLIKLLEKYEYEKELNMPTNILADFIFEELCVLDFVKEKIFDARFSTKRKLKLGLPLDK